MKSSILDKKYTNFLGSDVGVSLGANWSWAIFGEKHKLPSGQATNHNLICKTIQLEEEIHQKQCANNLKPQHPPVSIGRNDFWKFLKIIQKTEVIFFLLLF